MCTNLFFIDPAGLPPGNWVCFRETIQNKAPLKERAGPTHLHGDHIRLILLDAFPFNYEVMGMLHVPLSQPELSQKQVSSLQEMWQRCARRIILSTTLAGSGHPGGSLSSLHLLLVAYSGIRHDPHDPAWPERDRMVVSMGHVSPAIYSVLCEWGYIAEEQFLMEFRRAGSALSGHVERCVPGVEWNTGNLGQGLSAGAAMALALKVKSRDNRVLVLMGDGEQQKGQVSEARRFAVKYRLNNLVAIVDRNYLQIGGDTRSVMPQNVASEYAASCWNVIRLPDGHDFRAVYAALRQALTNQVPRPENPTVVVARTVMGKGISFMENNAKYHGCALTAEQAEAALEELGGNTGVRRLLATRRQYSQLTPAVCPPVAYPEIDCGVPITYPPDKLTDNRSAFGAALANLARLNNHGNDGPKVLGFSCDLETSVKMDGLHRESPAAFYEAGIQEHHTATMAGAISCEGFATFFSTFGTFAVCEVYNQQRLNDINQTHLKVVSTHCGIDVGEDGMTHQCIDYIGLLNNLFSFAIFVPADPNQTDRLIRYIASNPGNHFVAMGRSKCPVITDENGQPLFAGDYRFVPGRADWIRKGTDGVLITYGACLHRVLEAQTLLKRREGLRLGVLNMASIKPLDRKAILEAARTGLVVTVEDHNLNSGLGVMVSNVLAEEGVSCRFTRLGLSSYSTSGKPDDLYRLQGLDPESVAAAVKRLLCPPEFDRVASGAAGARGKNQQVL
ncbi:MAG: transketolase [Syntrophobacteria bacterium]